MNDPSDQSGPVFNFKGLSLMTKSTRRSKNTPTQKPYLSALSFQLPVRRGPPAHREGEGKVTACFK